VLYNKRDRTSVVANFTHFQSDRESGLGDHQIDFVHSHRSVPIQGQNDRTIRCRFVLLTVIVSAAWQRITTASWLVYQPEGHDGVEPLWRVPDWSLGTGRQSATRDHTGRHHAGSVFLVLRYQLDAVFVSSELLQSFISPDAGNT